MVAQAIAAAAKKASKACFTAEAWGCTAGAGPVTTGLGEGVSPLVGVAGVGVGTTGGGFGIATGGVSGTAGGVGSGVGAGAGTGCALYPYDLNWSTVPNQASRSTRPCMPGTEPLSEYCCMT